MKVIRGLHNLPQHHSNCVVTIGNFDGVHLGHQSLLQQLDKLAKEYGLPTVLILFEPQPQEFFARTKQQVTHLPPARLTSFRDKCRLLARYPIDNVFCLAFNEQQSKQSAEDFITETLVSALKIKHIVVGDDFRFGYQRQGDFHMLKQKGAEFGFNVSSIDEIAGEGERISSTRIRKLLLDNQLKEAAQLLGRPFTLSGRVVHGDERGRQLNFATANIPLKRAVAPLHGVYAVRVTGIGDRVLFGAANIGHRPTVNGEKWQLEVHLFDFNEMIYGQHLIVEFCHHIRDEKKFNSLDELKSQIAADCQTAKDYFLANPNGIES